MSDPKFRSRPKSSWRQRLILLCFSIGFSLVLGEVLLRVAGISFPVFDRYDEVLGIKLATGKEGWYDQEGKAFLRINSEGYRDREHPLEKPADTFRIAVLGDSFTEARQVDLEQTYWHLLGAELSGCTEFAGKKVEVLSFGIGSFGTTQQLLSYRHDARRYSPDLVLVGFFAATTFSTILRSV